MLRFRLLQLVPLMDSKMSLWQRDKTYTYGFTPHWGSDPKVKEHMFITFSKSNQIFTIQILNYR